MRRISRSSIICCRSSHPLTISIFLSIAYINLAGAASLHIASMILVKVIPMQGGIDGAKFLLSVGDFKSFLIASIYPLVSDAIIDAAVGSGPPGPYSLQVTITCKWKVETDPHTTRGIITKLLSDPGFSMDACPVVSIRCLTAERVHAVHISKAAPKRNSERWLQLISQSVMFNQAKKMPVSQFAQALSVTVGKSEKELLGCKNTEQFQHQAVKTQVMLRMVSDIIPNLLSGSNGEKTPDSTFCKDRSLPQEGGSAKNLNQDFASVAVPAILDTNCSPQTPGLQTSGQACTLARNASSPPSGRIDGRRNRHRRRINAGTGLEGNNLQMSKKRRHPESPGPRTQLKYRDCGSPQSKVSLKRRKDSPVPGELSISSFGEAGPAYEARLLRLSRASCGAARDGFKVVTAVVRIRSERGNASIPTSSDQIDRAAANERRKDGAELRGAYFNFAWQKHKDGCGPCGCAAETAGEKSAEHIARACGCFSTNGTIGSDSLPGCSGGGDVDGACESASAAAELEACSGAGGDSVSGAQACGSADSAQGGEPEKCADACCPGGSEKEIEAEGGSGDAHGPNSACRALASKLVCNMSPEFQQELLEVVHTYPVIEAEHRKELIGKLLEQPPRNRPTPDAERGRWREEQRTRPARESAPEPRKQRVLSEKNKDDLVDIATCWVSDMIPGLRKAVASDPRIKRFNLRETAAMKAKIRSEFLATEKAKRKNEIGLLKTAAKLSENGVSCCAYRSIRSVLVGMGLGYALPTERDLKAARAHLENNATQDLRIRQTEDGYFISLRAAIEMELLRMFEMPIDKRRKSESGARSVGNSGPGCNAWQEEFYVKITLDARLITKKTSHTEVMIQIFRRGARGAAESQSPLSIRTVGVWVGKDSKANVQANMKDFLAEVQELSENGVVFNMSQQTLLGQWEVFSKLSEEEKQKEMHAAAEDRRFPGIKINFIFASDMAALCATLGQGCAGNHYCAHCMAHEEERHLPFAMITTKEETSLQLLAHEYDMHARTLYAINAMEDIHKGVQPLTADGLRNSTANAMDSGEKAQAQAAAKAAAAVEYNGERRPAKKAKIVPVDSRQPDYTFMKTKVGWLNRAAHNLLCRCPACVIPKGTLVRVIPNVEFSRPSQFLIEHCPSLTAKNCPFCVLHCLMRVTEAMFHQICNAALTSTNRIKLVERLNGALEGLKINRQFEQSQKTKNWERVTFEGHQAKALLATDEEGTMGIEKVLEAMWPGSTSKSESCKEPEPAWRVCAKEYGADFVPRTVEVWRQWAVVDKLQSERFVEHLRKDKVDGEDGFARYGKECRDFIFRFQSMSTVHFSKSYYLHTLLHHAGELMRALEKMDMTLGMMSNSGAERRHEYGRRASRKALASNGWRKKNPEYDKKPNLIAYLTLKELLMWQYGNDLISHELARLSKEGNLPGPLPTVRGAVQFTVESRRAVFAASEPRPRSETETEEDRIVAESDPRIADELEPLLTTSELDAESRAQPYDPPPSFETSDSTVWGIREGSTNRSRVILSVQPDGSDERSFNPDYETRINSDVPCMVSDDESVAGSEECLPFHRYHDFGSDDDDADFDHRKTQQLSGSDSEVSADEESNPSATAGVRGLGVISTRAKHPLTDPALPAPTPSSATLSALQAPVLPSSTAAPATAPPRTAATPGPPQTAAVAAAVRGGKRRLQTGISQAAGGPAAARGRGVARRSSSRRSPATDGRRRAGGRAAAAAGGRAAPARGGGGTAGPPGAGPGVGESGGSQAASSMAAPPHAAATKSPALAAASSPLAGRPGPPSALGCGASAPLACPMQADSDGARRLNLKRRR